MSRDAFSPVAYSPATRRAIAKLEQQLHLRQSGLASPRSRFRLTSQSTIVGLSIALEFLAEQHRQWDDVERFAALRTSALREVSDWEFMGKLPADERAEQAVIDAAETAALEAVLPEEVA